MSSTDFIFNDASFETLGKIGNGLPDETLKKFYRDHIAPHPNYSLLMSQMSHMYVLTACLGSEGLVEEGETKWQDIMPEKQYQFLKKNRKLIAGYMLMEEKGECSYIKICDTAVRDNNILKYMIKRYKKEKGISHALPYTIPSSATGYFKKYFQEEYGIESDTQLTNWMELGTKSGTSGKLPNLDWDIVRDGWESLFQNWDNINGLYDPNNEKTSHTLGKSQDFLKEL
jgi:hypothetical protein